MTSAGYSEKWPWQISSSLGVCKLKPVQLGQDCCSSRWAQTTKLQSFPALPRAWAAPGSTQLLALHPQCHVPDPPHCHEASSSWGSSRGIHSQTSAKELCWERRGKEGSCWMKSWFKMLANLLLAMSLFPSLSLFPTASVAPPQVSPNFSAADEQHNTFLPYANAPIQCQRIHFTPNLTPVHSQSFTKVLVQRLRHTWVYANSTFTLQQFSPLS